MSSGYTLEDIFFTLLTIYEKLSQHFDSLNMLNETADDELTPCIDLKIEYI